MSGVLVRSRLQREQEELLLSPLELDPDKTPVSPLG